MDYLQYYHTDCLWWDDNIGGFKPYYKWITFNTFACYLKVLYTIFLNLIINGLPSIRIKQVSTRKWRVFRFKPYYKWITFNTGAMTNTASCIIVGVLNLIINGLPSILCSS